VPAPAELEQRLVKQSNTWANCSVEDLYGFLKKCQALTPENQVVRRVKGSSGKSIIMNKVETRQFDIPIELLRAMPNVDQESLDNFCLNIDMLGGLEIAYSHPDIVGKFLPLPQELKGRDDKAINEPLQKIKAMCMELLETEYLVLARLFLAETFSEKYTLLTDYMLTEEGAILRQNELYYGKEMDEQHIRMLTTDCLVLFEHYSHAVASVYHLTTTLQILRVTNIR
jgi:hypothetical protein